MTRSAAGQHRPEIGQGWPFRQDIEPGKQHLGSVWRQGVNGAAHELASQLRLSQWLRFGARGMGADVFDHPAILEGDRHARRTLIGRVGKGPIDAG